MKSRLKLVVCGTALATTLVATGCGTVVGNPKKPKDDTKSDAIVFKLPEIELTVPGEAKDDDATLALAGDDFGDGNKTILTSWGKRFDRAVRRTNSLSQRINKILEKHEDEEVDGVLVFKNRGEERLTSGKIQVLPASGEYATEAVLCYDGKMLAHLQWSADGQHLELTRDLSVKSAGETESFALVTSLKLTKTVKTVVDFATQGTVAEDNLSGTDGEAFTESSHVERDETGFKVRAVADNRDPVDDVADGAYEGDRYLVGQVTEAGAEFAAYFKGLKVPCKNGFDETEAGIWQGASSGPRFCVGRPLGGKRFKSASEYATTLAHLQPIGIQPQAELHAVKFPDGLSCE